MTRSVEPTTAPYRRRIVGHADVDPRSLTPHPLNPRMHPYTQREALAGVLESIGWLQDVIVNVTTGHMIDGHLRRDHAIDHNEPTVPVTYIEITEAEEPLALATFDPLGTLAIVDDSKMQELIERAQTDNAQVQVLLTQLAEMARAPDGRDPYDDLVGGSPFDATDVQFEIVATAIDATARDRIVGALQQHAIEYEVRTIRT